MSAQFRLLLQQMLARTQQIPIVFLFLLRNVDNTQQAIGIELRQLPRINAIGFDLLATGARDARRGDHSPTQTIF